MQSTENFLDSRRCRTIFAVAILTTTVVFCQSGALADVTITSPTTNNEYYDEANMVELSGTASSNATRIDWSCRSGCNQRGTASGISSWATGAFYVESGSNIIDVTAHYSDGSSESDSILVYRTVPHGLRISFPYELDFDTGPSSLEQRIFATRGAAVSHQTTGCWQGGCAKIVPSQFDNSYAALGGFFFPDQSRRVNVRYLVKFGPDFVDNLNLRSKHILAHRASDVSGDRGMSYIWRADSGDFSLGACDNTDCSYEGDKYRPDGSEAFTIGAYLDEWVSIETEFDTLNHRIRTYVTTSDGRLDNYLLTEQSIHSISQSLDYWTRISILGAYIDLGTVPSEGMFFMLDEIVISDSYIGPPSGFGSPRAELPRPEAPELF